MHSYELEKRLKALEHKIRYGIVALCSELPTTNVGKIVIFNSEIYFWNGTSYEKILTEDDLVNLVSQNDLAWLTQDIQDGLVNSPTLDGTNYVVTLDILQNAINSVGVGTNISTIDVYSNLPAANLNPGIFYWVEQDQGTWWLPGNLGGTYYKKGLYYSNGTTWETAPVPYQATQTEVNDGIEQYKFVTPNTLQTKLNNLKYTETLPSTFTHTILQTTHGLSKVSGINLYNLSGDNVSIDYNISSNNIIINSNVNLLNHIIEIY